jgi:glycerol-3-phosphate dehydrogenase (NAD(P)+)
VSAPVVVLGGGSWATALAASMRRGGHAVRLWARRPEIAAEIARGTNEQYLPGCPLPPGIDASSDLGASVRGARAVVVGLPAATTRSIIEAARRYADPQTPWVLLAKGLELHTGRRLSEVAADALGGGRSRVFVLLGPSHAEEVARAMPTAVVLAGTPGPVRSSLQRELSSPSLRIYTNDDQPGVELAAALKNVLAIAAGMGDGIGLGDNGKGALLTRGVAELSRLGVTLGGRRDTFFGLAGVGDVVTTCLSRHSRNRALGERIARGETLDEALAGIGQVVEGVDTTRTVVELADARGLAVPIARAVASVLFGDTAPDVAMRDLMTRSLKGEWDDVPPDGGDEIRTAPTRDPVRGRIQDDPRPGLAREAEPRER